MFACKNSGEKDVVGSQYGSLAYGDLGEKPRVRKRYGKEYTKFAAESFERLALKRSVAPTENKAQTHFVWVFPAPFAQCAMDRRRYLPGNKERKERRRLSPRAGNVQFKCAAPRSIAYYKNKRYCTGSP